MMFFSKKAGFHCLVLLLEDHPLHIVIPQEVAEDVISSMKKLEKSPLNNQTYIGDWGPFQILYDIQGFQKIEVYNSSHSYSEPIFYTDMAKKLTARLESWLDEESHQVEEDLVYFIGEFTMMQDNGFVAPF